MLKVQIIEINNSQEWDALFSEYSDCTLFHTCFWSQVIENTYQIKGYLLEFLQDGEQIGLIPVWLTKKAGLTLAGSPLRQTATHFCGPLLKKRINIDLALESLYKFLSENFGVNYLDITLPKPANQAKFLKWNVKIPKTFILDLNRSEQEIWKSFEGRMRTAVRKAEKSGVEIQVLQVSDREIDVFYGMLEKVYRRYEIKPPFPKSFYKNLLIPQSPYAFLYGARFEEHWIAMALILKYRDWMNYHSAASLREYGKFGANNLLQWKVILDGLKEGIKMYDLGAGSGIRGIEKFKMSMRPYKAYYQNMWRANLIGSLARTIYEKILPWMRKIK
ncbi:MAG: hypothetical protein DRP84_07955 [Spirochaetes bacterium]|nr:MAG: hypothetical protein DRP84_07955 [Spirochaetota bacterium]RLJ03744.1 MAG: hypothetical protein DRP08_03085 [Candidatus Aenigmarchaeota archaeon]HDK27527.1 GNAT family N-acetyltransferase [Candidatus Atribacteria bacterium]